MSRRTRPVETDPSALTPDDYAHMVQTVESVRTEEGLGGQCGWVAEILATRHGWDMYSGIYHSLDGRPIGDHVWNVHTPSGIIIDATADQFGEGTQIRILTPSDPTHARYRHAQTDEQEEDWLNVARARRDTDGDYWWVPGGMSNPDVMAYEARVVGWENVDGSHSRV